MSHVNCITGRGFTPDFDGMCRYIVAHPSPVAGTLHNYIYGLRWYCCRKKLTSRST